MVDGSRRRVRVLLLLDVVGVVSRVSRVRHGLRVAGVQRRQTGDGGWVGEVHRGCAAQRRGRMSGLQWKGRAVLGKKRKLRGALS